MSMSDLQRLEFKQAFDEFDKVCIILIANMIEIENERGVEFVGYPTKAQAYRITWVILTLV